MISLLTKICVSMRNILHTYVFGNQVTDLSSMCDKNVDLINFTLNDSVVYATNMFPVCVCDDAIVALVSTTPVRGVHVLCFRGITTYVLFK